MDTMEPQEEKQQQESDGDSTHSFQPMEVDEALTLLGRYGRWQITYFIILSIGMMFFGCWNTFGYMFQAYTPPHHCRVDNNNNTDLSSVIPWDNETDSYSSCLIYVNGSQGNETRDCSDDVNDWTYYGDDVTDTVVSDWNLVCNRAYMKQMTSTVNAFGILLGSAFFAPLIDKFGRRPLFLGGLWVTIAVGVWNAFATNYYEYCVIRFLMGFLRPCSGSAAFVLACELFPAKQRTFAGVIIEDFWGVALCILALLMYLIENWRYLQLLLSLLGLLTIPLYWFLPESIPWLLSKGRLQEAEDTIQSAARFNRLKNFPKNIFILQPDVQDPSSYTSEKKGSMESLELEKKDLPPPGLPIISLAYNCQKSGSENMEIDFELVKNYSSSTQNEILPPNGIGAVSSAALVAKSDKEINKICEINSTQDTIEQLKSLTETEINEETKTYPADKIVLNYVNDVKSVEKSGYENKALELEDVDISRSGEISETFYDSNLKISAVENPGKAKYSLLDILRHSKLRLFLFICCILWFVNSTVYYGMTLNTEDLAGDRYLNLFLSGLVEIPAYTISYFVIVKWGRRVPAVLFHWMAGVFLIISAFIPDQTGDGTDLVPLQITMVMLGKFGITATFGIIYLFTPELFPTAVRSQALGVASVFGRAGGMVAPFSASLNDIEPYLTSVVFGVVSIFGGLTVLVLPETNKRALPQTIEDIEAWLQPKNLSGENQKSSSDDTSSINSISGDDRLVAAVANKATSEKLNLTDEAKLNKFSDTINAIESLEGSLDDNYITTL